ncbi:hypothetical protein HY972_01730 [Candidatus Kaiserbacteria bacterium]|nr:hypothetical protein [Candidatus Kaiserbacteria bacterium]
MQEQAIIETQLEFYRKGGAGCLFAAHAARDPSKYEWRLSVSNVDKVRIEELIQSAISLAGVSTQSIIFPSVMEQEDLKNLLLTLKETSSVSLEQEEEFEGAVCLGYRVNVGDLKSWMTGFGSFDFFPKTRQAVFAEIVFRTKPRPDYNWAMKETPPGIIHLADMDMKGMRENQFKALWYGSFDNTENILGHKPDLRSAAKTTFAVPLELWKG